MTWEQALLAFTAFSIVVTVTPGPDTVLVLRSGLTRGRAPALAVSTGAATGSLTWGVIAAVGVASLLRHSPLAFSVLRYSGAVYLAYLGVRTLLESSPESLPEGSRPESGHRPGDTRSPRIGWYYLSGLLSDLLSPKAGLYFLAILPQFVPKSWPPLPSMIALAALDGILVLAWLGFLAYAAQYAARRLQHPRFHKITTVICGVSLMGLSVGIVLAKI